MKKLIPISLLGLGLLLLPRSTDAISITIENATSDNFTCDVVWGPAYDGVTFLAQASENGFIMYADEGHNVISVHGASGDGNFFTYTDLAFPGLRDWDTDPLARLAVLARFVVWGAGPTSTIIADGYGVELSWDLTPWGVTIGGGTGGGGNNGSDGDNTGSVPDGGNSLLLLGSSLAIIGLFRFKRS